MPAFDELYFTGTGWMIRDGDLYVSSIGSDDIDEGDGSPLSPYATINKAIEVASAGQKIVVGTGTYREEIEASSKNILLYGDGHVILTTEVLALTAFANLGTSSIINGFHISGYETAIDGNINKVENCFIEDASLTNYGGQINYCVLKNNAVEAVGVTTITNCTFISATVGGTSKNNITNIYDSIFDSGSILDIVSATTVNFDYCNQEGGSQVKVNGSNYSTAAAVHAAFPSYQTKGMTISSGFNKPSVNDYSLSLTSGLQKAGRFYKFVGARGQARAFYKSSLGGATLTGVVINSGRYELDDGIEEGTITTRILDMEKVTSIGKITLFADQEFETPPFNAVVDASVEDRPPNVITYFMRYGNSTALINAAGYKEYLWDQIPSVDSEGRGNGDPEFDFSEQENIEARYLQFTIVLKRALESFFLVQENDDCLLQENSSNIIWKY